jgi:hypothetical protein
MMREQVAVSDDTFKHQASGGKAIRIAPAGRLPLTRASRLSINTPSSCPRLNPVAGSQFAEGSQMRVTLEFVKAKAEETKSETRWGRVLEPVPREQVQEGPTCGFYALSIVMDYWKAKGRTKMSAPARQRDIDTQKRDPAEREPPSLRNLGKQTGALDVGGMVKASTGGVWTATQLAAVAAAVKFANFKVSIETKVDPTEFVMAIFDAIDADVPPIVAFDVREAEPVSDAAGQRSHWGVIIGYYEHLDMQWVICTHGHGGYHVWPALKLQCSNFALTGTTVKRERERKVRGSGVGLKGPYEKYNRTQWMTAAKRQEFATLIAERKLEATFTETDEIREGVEATQDLGRHLVLVEPAR